MIYDERVIFDKEKVKMSPLTRVAEEEVKSSEGEMDGMCMAKGQIYS